MAAAQMKQMLDQQIEMALSKLNHIPYITSQQRKIATWSDVREVLFIRCIHPRCTIVLSALKSCLRYPATEKFMHPCTPWEQVQFMKQCMAVAVGTLLVDLYALENRFDLMTLFDMIKIKHDLMEEDQIWGCCALTEARRNEKCFQKCTRNPLKNKTGKLFLPSIQSKNTKEHEKDENTDSFIKSVQHNMFIGEARRALVPMCLLREIFPESKELLEEVSRLYITGQCAHTSLTSVSKCSPEEGLQLSRFMAMQYGFEKSWFYFTSNSLLMSLEEFWQHSGISKKNRLHLSVVILNCKTLDLYEGGRSDPNISNVEQLESSETGGKTGLIHAKSKQAVAQTTPCMISTNNCMLHKEMVRPNQMIDDRNPTQKEGKHEYGKGTLQSLTDTKELKKSKTHTTSTASQLKKDTTDKVKSHLCKNPQMEPISKEVGPLQMPSIENESAPHMIKTKTNLMVTRSKLQSNDVTNTNRRTHSVSDVGDMSYQNCQEMNEDANNSADIDNVSSKNIHCNSFEPRHEEEENEHNNDEQYECQSTKSNNSILTDQGDFGSGKIDVSITLKNNSINDTLDMAPQENQPNEEPCRKRSPNKLIGRKTLKLAISQFSNKIPDQMKVKQYVLKDMVSGKKQLTPRSESPVDKKRDKAGVKGCDKPREGLFVTKSLELDIPEISSNIEHTEKEQFPYKARREQVIEKKEEGNTFSDAFPIVNGIKLRTSPLKTKERSPRKGSMKLPMQKEKKSNRTVNRNPRGLPFAIISNLEQNAFNSICSVRGNSDLESLEGIVANGKEIISQEKGGMSKESLQCNHVAISKNRNEHDSNTSKQARQCKSADMCTKKKSPYLYRPSSSSCSPYYSDETNKDGSSLGLDVYVAPTKSSEDLQKANSLTSSLQTKKWSPCQTKYKPSKVCQDNVTVVPNYGASSSSTPDIYDEFASKRKPKVRKTTKKEQKCGQYTKICDKLYDQIPDSTKQQMSLKSSLNGPCVKSAKSKSFEETDKCYPHYRNSEANNSPSTWKQTIVTTEDLSEQNNSVYIDNTDEVMSNPPSSCRMCRHESKHYVHYNNCNLQNTGSGNTSLTPFPSKTDNLEGNADRTKTANIDNLKKRITLLDKINLFVDGTTSPKASESLEDLENINNIIRINPMDTSFIKNSLTSSDKDTLNMCMKVQAENLTPKLSDKNTTISYRNTKTSNDCILWNLETYKHLNTVNNWENIGEKNCAEYPESHLTTNCGQNNTYLPVLETQRKESERHSTHFADQLCHNDEKQTQDESNIDGINHLPNKCLNSSESSESEQDYDNLLIDSYQHDTMYTSPKYLDPVLHDTHDCSEPIDERSQRNETFLQNITKERTERLNEATNKAKHFQEFVKKKRTLGPEKKEFWESSSTSYSKTFDAGGRKYAMKSSTGKKYTIKYLSDLKTTIQISDTETITRKNNQYAQIDDAEGIRMQENAVHERLNREIKSEKMKNKTIDSLSTVGETDISNTSGTLAKEKKRQLKNKVRRPKTVDTKSVNKRVLRPRAVKSARARRRSIKKSSLKDSTNPVDYDTIESNINEANDITNEHFIGGAKSINRKKKVRNNVCDSLLVGQNKSKKNKRVSKSHKTGKYLQSEPDNIEIDQSNILCETIPYDSILETNIEQTYRNETDVLTQIFMTQCSTDDLKDSNQLEIFHKSPTHDNISNGTEENINTKKTINLSQNAIVEIKPEVLQEVEPENASIVEPQINDFVDSNIWRHWLYQDENGDLKEVDLSELPQSVLEVVLSDDLMEMPSCSNTMISEPNEMHTTPAELEMCSKPNDKFNDLQQKDSLELNEHGSKNPLIDEIQMNSSECKQANNVHGESLLSECQQKVERAFNQIGKNMARDDMNEHASDAVGKGITVMHPNGSKVVLTENHPAFTLFSDIFQKPDCAAEENGNETKANSLQVTRTDVDKFIEPPLLITEVKSRGQKQENTDCIIWSTDNGSCAGQNCVTTDTIQPVDTTNMKHGTNVKDNKEAQHSQKSQLIKHKIVTKEQVSMCFDSAKETPVRQNTQPYESGHRENIFDVLTAELNSITQQRTRDAQLELFPETIVEEINNVELKNKYVDLETELKGKCIDFENELIKMIKENFDSESSAEKGSHISKGLDQYCDTIAPQLCKKGNNGCNGDMKSGESNTNRDVQSGKDREYDNTNSNEIIDNNQPSDKKNLKTKDGQRQKSDNIGHSDETCSIKSNETSLYNANAPNEISTFITVNEQKPIFRSAALGLRVAKSKLNTDNQNWDISESESSKTYEYGVSSNSCTDVTSSEFQISDDDVTDCDYCPEGEESECSLPEGYNENVNNLFARLKQHGHRYDIKDGQNEIFQETFERQDHINNRGGNVTHTNTDSTSGTWSTSTESNQSGETNLSSDISCNQLSERKEESSHKTKKHKKEQRKQKSRHGKNKTKHKTKIQTIQEDLEEESAEKTDDIVAANNLVKTQKLYFDILKTTSGSMEDQTKTSECSIDIENLLSDGFTVKRDRDITRAEAKADRLKEGTGSLEDFEKDDDSNTIVEDPITNCRYQIVEDEDGISLGGVVYYNEYTLPFVYINGYKYTPLKDAVTLFQPDCCAWKCRIPKTVMTKNKKLIKTFSTWDQVYKLELIKLKKGPPITTGDTLVKLDSLVDLLPTLLLEIIAKHRDSKLKHSQDCDMNSYSLLQSKFVGNK